MKERNRQTGTRGKPEPSKDASYSLAVGSCPQPLLSFFSTTHHGQLLLWTSPSGVENHTIHCDSSWGSLGFIRLPVLADLISCKGCTHLSVCLACLYNRMLRPQRNQLKLISHSLGIVTLHSTVSSQHLQGLGHNQTSQLTNSYMHLTPN